MIKLTTATKWLPVNDGTTCLARTKWLVFVFRMTIFTVFFANIGMSMKTFLGFDALFEITMVVTCQTLLLRHALASGMTTLAI